MVWVVRDRKDKDIYTPREHPDYSAAQDLFTIKLHHGGKFMDTPKRYVGGSVDYIDLCDVDTMSLIELMTMSKDCGDLGAVTHYYKHPNTDMEKGLWNLESDSDVVDMCYMMPTSRILYMYSVSHKPLVSLTPEGVLTQEYAPSQDPNLEFVDNPISDHEDDEDEDDEDEDEDEDDPDWEDKGQSEHDELSDESWDSDSSNMDSTDEDVCEYKTERLLKREKKEIAKQKVKGKDKEKGKQKEKASDAAHAEKEPEHNMEPEKDIDSDDEWDLASDVSSHYAGSDEETMAGNSTDEDEISYPAFDHNTEMGDPKFQIGLLFATAKIFRSAVKKHAILHRRPIKQCRNYGSKVRFVCEAPCEWKIYASKMQRTDTYQIKVYKPIHTCTPTFHHKQINSTWIAEQYEDDIRMNPTWPLASFLQKVVNDWHWHVSIYAIARATRKAMKKINGKHVDQYGKVWEYGNELLKVMPNSTIQVMTEDQEFDGGRKRFKRFYTCFGPLKRGFSSGCRPLVGLDGCHLKGPYGGQLLAAVGTDANDGMYPIAWAVVEAENTDSWNWFLVNLKSDPGIENDGAFTFISDRQKGLINALEALFPQAEHRFCVMHLYRNMWKDHKGIGVRMLLWLAARATTEYTFKKHMQELKKLSKKCYDWLIEKPRTQWSRSAFRLICKSDMFVNNHCEVFNNSIRKYRDLPIISMLKAIHKDVMRRIQQRRDKMQNSYALNPICPNVMRRLHKAIEQSRGCHVVWSGGARYLVTMTAGGYEMVVDLEAGKCACRKWEMSGIPCYHVCACIAWSKKTYEPFIHQCYSKDLFLECYQHIVEPICGEEEWEETSYPKPLPPQVKVQIGRPKKKRNKVNDVVNADPTRLKRQNTKVKCSYCTEYSHNMRTCPARAAHRANGCERQVKTRPKPKPKAASTQSNPTTAVQNERGDHNPTPSVEKPSGKVKRATNPNESIHGGTTTSRQNLEAKRREMQDKLKKNPVWQI